VNKYGWIEYAPKKGDEEGSEEDGDAKPKEICRAFDPLDMVRDEQGDGWELRVAYHDRDEREHIARIPESELHKHNSDLRSRLVNEGFRIKLGAKGFNGLLWHLAENVKGRSILVSKPGWRSDRKTFVCPDGMLVGANGGEGIILESAFSDQRAGSLEGQLQAWKIAFEHGGAHHMIGCLGGVAGAVVQFCRLGTTPIIALTGGSSGGKTTSMMLAAGSWGWPQVLKEDKSRGGVLHSLRSTTNAIEFIAMRSTGTFFGGDETAHMESKEMEKLAFMLAEGVGKQRMTADIKERELKSWSTFAMVSSEIPISKLYENSGESARVGLTARLADINVDDYAQLPDAEYDQMKKIIEENYGWTGPAFVKHMIDSGLDPATVRDEILANSSSLAGSGASPLVRRAAGVFGVLMVVGELLGAAKLLPAGVTHGEVSRRIRVVWEDYKASEVAEVLDPTAQAITILQENLRADMGNTVHSIDEQADRKSKATLAWYEPIRDDSDTGYNAFGDNKKHTEASKQLPPTTFFVRKDSLVRLSGGKLGEGKVRKALEAAGILQRPNHGETIHHRYVPNVGAVNAYKLVFGSEG
jgi:hypothetical protein